LGKCKTSQRHCNRIRETDLEVRFLMKEKHKKKFKIIKIRKMKKITLKTLFKLAISVFFVLNSTAQDGKQFVSDKHTITKANGTATNITNEYFYQNKKVS
jgi:hypothetical protein